MQPVSHKVLSQYLNFEIDEKSLFPADAPAGTTLQDLEPENGDPAVCTLENTADLLERFLDEDISFDAFQSWIASMLELDLFVFDNSKGDESMDWMFDTLDYLAGFDDEEVLLDKVDLTKLIEKAESF